MIEREELVAKLRAEADRQDHVDPGWYDAQGATVTRGIATALRSLADDLATSP